METVTIKISPAEKARLLVYCESVNDSGHWGDGAVELPDEKILEDKIRSADTSLDLTLRDMEILTIHIENDTDHGYMLLPEDQSLIAKLLQIMEPQRDSDSNSSDRIDRVIRSFAGFLTGKRSADIPAPTVRSDTFPASDDPSAVFDSAVAAAEEPSPIGSDTDDILPPAGAKKGLLSRIIEFINPDPFAARPAAPPAGDETTFEERVKRAKAAAQRIGKRR